MWIGMPCRPAGTAANSMAYVALFNQNNSSTEYHLFVTAFVAFQNSFSL
jgi:hypothetical protein